jgi:nucleotide-binding universal stress UspA family protein
VFDRILVPHDGSSAADAAIAWAARLPVDVVRLVRVEPDLGPAIGELSGLGPDAPLADDRTAALAELEAAARPLSDAGRRVELSLLSDDDPAEAILAAASAPPADLIAMATHGRGAIGQLLLGSIAGRVAHHAPVPVLLVRPGNLPSTVARVIVPLDGSELAETALPFAGRLARELGATLHFVRVIDDVAIVRQIVSRWPPGVPQPDDAWDQARSELETAARRYLDDVAARSSDVQQTTIEVATGTPAFILLELIRPNDVVAMTSHGAGGLRRWLIGSVADKLVREAAAPVLLVPSRAAA